MSADPRVLVVEDSATILAFLAHALAPAGYSVATVRDGIAAVESFRARRPDVVVLDVDLPGLSGWEVLERIRATDERVPVLMLTALDDERSKVRGLTGGADDYLVKPIGPAELRARVAALLRRARLAAPDAPADGHYDDGHLRIDFAARRVTVAGREVQLTPVEFRLLTAFTSRPGEVLTRQALLEQVWQDYTGGPGDQVKV